MILKHRGYTLEASRERAMGGWTDVYWSAFRDRDGYELTSGFGEYATPREAINVMRLWVDALIDHFGGRIAKRDEAHDCVRFKDGKWTLVPPVAPAPPLR